MKILNVLVVVKKLNLSATIKFNCELVKEEDFDLTHTSKKYSDRLVLKGLVYIEERDLGHFFYL